MTTPGGSEHTDEPSNEPDPSTEPSRPGPVHDTAMHYLVENDLPGFCDWLKIKLDQPAQTLSPVFAAEKLTADLLLKVGPQRLLHVEYVRKPAADLYVRMLGYRAHIMRRHPRMSLTQFVIVLGPGRVRSEDDLENGFYLGLRTIYLPRVDPEEFLSRPGLAVLAELAKGNQETRFRSALAALQVIQGLPEPRRQGLQDAMYTLATISFDPSTIDQIREESRMTVESIIEFYDQTKIGREVHDILRERARLEAHEQVREEVRQEARLAAHEEVREEARQAAREEALAAVIRSRFGDDRRIRDVAHSLAGISMEASVAAIEQATSLEDLLDRRPSAEPDPA